MSQRSHQLAKSGLCKRILDFIERNPDYWPAIRVKYTKGEVVVSARCRGVVSDEYCWKMRAKCAVFTPLRQIEEWISCSLECGQQDPCTHNEQLSCGVNGWLTACIAAPSLLQMEAHIGRLKSTQVVGYGYCWICNVSLDDYEYYCDDDHYGYDHPCREILLEFLRSSLVLWAVNNRLVLWRLPCELWEIILDFLAQIVREKGQRAMPWRW